MLEMVELRRNAEKKEQRADLLSTLLDANDAFADSDLRLTDQEVLGMAFIVIRPIEWLISTLSEHLHLPHCRCVFVRFFIRQLRPHAV